MFLQTAIDTIDYPEDLTVGIYVRDVVSGETAGKNANRLFQLASTFKVPILVAAMRQAERRHFNLDRRVTVHNQDKIAGSILAHLDDGLALTIRDLLTLMIIVSDNTATDIILDEIGGYSAVEHEMRKMGLQDIYLHQSVRELLHSIEPVDDLVLTEYDYVQYIKRTGIKPTTQAVMNPAVSNFATARVMTDLFYLIETGRTTDKELTDQMRNILLRQQYDDRIPADLPYATRVAHKTGSIAGVRNDTGIIYLPNDRPIALTVFVEYAVIQIDSPEQNKQDSKASALIASVAAAIYKSAVNQISNSHSW